MSSRSTRIAVAGITAVVVAGGAGTAYAALSSSGPSYRLASVTSADVTATLQEVGTLNPLRQADVAFAVGGTVASVAVSPGQHVSAGQQLGSLGLASFSAGVTAAKLTLANANLQVANDMASQDAAAAPAASPSASAGLSPPLRRLQRAVLAAQRLADSALAKATAALAQASQACPPVPAPASTQSATPGTGTPPAPGTGTPPAGPSPGTRTPKPAPSPTPSPVSCAAATAQLLTAEIAVQHAQRALAGRLTALSAALGSAGSKQASPGTGSHSSSGTGGATGAGGPVSAAQLAADQAAADAAAAQVTAAEQNLGAATVVSPITGTVVSVNVTAGSAVSAGSTAFVIAGLDTYQVLTTVAVTGMPKIKVGQRASVLPDGRGRPLPGSVVSIGLVPTPGSSPATYPVTIGLTGSYSGLHAGGYASVTITTAVASGLSVPTSAVHHSGHTATVTVYAGGRTHITRVTVGTIGPVMTRILSGLSLGQQVVLADLSKPLPTASPFPGPGPGSGAVFIAPGQRHRVFRGGGP